MRFFHQQSYQSILSHAQDLLRDVQLERESAEEAKRPIIFVGHSLGGLVIKEALCRSANYAQRKTHVRLAAIENHCTGIVFLGTPHRGADLATWATTASRLAQALGKASNDELLSSLKTGSPVLESLLNSFAGIQSRFNIYSILEAQAIQGIGKVRVTVLVLKWVIEFDVLTAID